MFKRPIQAGRSDVYIQIPHREPNLHERRADVGLDEFDGTARFTRGRLSPHAPRYKSQRTSHGGLDRGLYYVLIVASWQVITK